MAFRTNSSKANEGSSVKEEGYYEVIIDAAEVRTIPSSGKQKVGLCYVIRNDVEQKYRNGLIFHDVWKKREPNEDDMQVDGFNFGQLMSIASAAKLPDGQEYETLDKFLAELRGKAVRVHLFHDEYNGKIYEKVDRHMPTDFPDVKHKPKEKATGTSYAAAPQTTFASSADKAPQVGDDDYPF